MSAFDLIDAKLKQLAQRIPPETPPEFMDALRFNMAVTEAQPAKRKPGRPPKQPPKNHG